MLPCHRYGLSFYVAVVSLCRSLIFFDLSLILVILSRSTFLLATPVAMKQRLQAAVFKRATRPTILILNNHASSFKYSLFHTNRAFFSQSTLSTFFRKPPTSGSKLRGVSALAAAAFCASLIYSSTDLAEPPSTKFKRSQIRTIRLEEVKKHGREAEAKWVTHGIRVFDITDWILSHPGGEVILRAAGGSVDPYWNIFTIHKKEEVYDILEQYYVGNIDPRDLVNGEIPVENIDDPFVQDPKRDKRLVVHSERPCNAETPAEELESFVTPNETFYVRNHLWVPEIDESRYKLILELPDGEEKEYSLKDLKEKFEKVTITATLQCSGNRRNHMTKEVRPTKGLQWNVGGISNAEWTGIRLRDLLADAGFPVDEVPQEVRHAQFMGAEAYGASIPIDKATDKRGDVLLAYEMNGKPLPPDHGFPFRVLVPGNVAARSVKWVTKIVLSEEESTSQWQRRDYKCFGPNVGSANPNWESAPSIQEMPVQSAITSLRDISTASKRDRQLLHENGHEEDSVIVEGYCYSGGGRAIVRVDVSADGGKTWHQAELLPDKAMGSKVWAWKRWRWVVPRRDAGSCFVVKAVDEAYNTQSNDYESTYNFRGNLTSSWHRVEYGPDDKKS